MPSKLYTLIYGPRGEFVLGSISICRHVSGILRDVRFRIEPPRVRLVIPLTRPHHVNDLDMYFKPGI